jgi:hypothetical protein
MPYNFFALCKVNKKYDVRKITLNLSLQDNLTALFNEQKAAFLSSGVTEVPFTGDWKPNEDEVLTISSISEVSLLQEAIQSNFTTMPELELSKHASEPIKAIFTGEETDGVITILLQKFQPRQYLDRSSGFSLFKVENGFERIESPIISLDNKLLCVIEGDKVKFKSFAVLKHVFDVSSFYQEATDADIDKFAIADVLHIEDQELFKKLIDGTTTRKLIHNIVSMDVLNTYSAEEIKQSAIEDGLDLILENGRLVFPQDKKKVVDLLNFLNDTLYTASLSKKRYVTNSHRPA